jgi:hypothetical protein
MVVCPGGAAAQTVPSGEPGWRFSVTPIDAMNAEPSPAAPTVAGARRRARKGEDTMVDAASPAISPTRPLPAAPRCG